MSLNTCEAASTITKPYTIAGVAADIEEAQSSCPNQEASQTKSLSQRRLRL
jgi:hypothetical protein